MIIYLIIANIFVVLFRSVFRNIVILQEQEIWQTDYLNVWSTQFNISLFAGCFCPFMTAFSLKLGHLSGVEIVHEEDSLAVLNLQQLLSLVQIICFLVYYTMSVSPDYGSDWYQRNARYIVLSAVLIYSLVVPVLSIMHWTI